MKKNKSNTEEKNKAQALFICFTLTLTQNNTSTSLVGDCYLRTLKSNMTLRIECRFYEKSYTVFQKIKIKKKQFS
jgi:hypothetical protein